MAERNVRTGATATGITPQVHGDVLTDKLNRETAGEIADLKKKVNPEPGPGEAPADAPRFYIRDLRHGWPFAQGAVTVASGGADVVIPGSGLQFGTLYKGERIHVELFLWGLTNSGPGYTSTELWATRGQGSPVAMIDQRKPFFATAGGGVPHAWFAFTLFEAEEFLEQAEVRFKLGSGGGTINLPDGSATYQHGVVYTPITRPSE